MCFDGPPSLLRYPLPPLGTGPACVGLGEFSGGCRRNELHYTPLSCAGPLQDKVLLALSVLVLLKHV